MEYQDIIVFILIFILGVVCFYIVMDNFGINNTNSTKSTQEELMINLTNNISGLKSEINSIKNKLTNDDKNQNELKSNIKINDDKIQNESKNILNDVANINVKINNDDNGITNTPIIYDPIQNYDRAKLLDPLVDPRGRTAADQIPTLLVASQFNIPTQGIADRYHRVGLLIALESDDNLNSDNNSSNFKINKKRKSKHNSDTNSESTTQSYKGVEIAPIEGFEGFENIETFQTLNNHDDNSILELIGKKITDNWYKYFTSISKGNKVIKITVHNKNRRELYCGDIVYVPELGKKFKVKIDPMDMVEYNPYSFNNFY